MTLILLLLFGLLCYGLYNILYHPLSKFPGPLLYRAFPLPVIYLSLTGKLARRLAELHEKYGPVVRIAPNELSFISAKAWPDIYGLLHGRRQMLRDPIQYPHDIGGILLLDDQEHVLHRKLLADHFARKGIEQIQGPKITGLANILIEQLKSEIDKGNRTQEMGAWFTWLAFDVAGEITFSQSLNSVQSMEGSPWMRQITQAVLQSIVANQLNRFGILTVLKKLAPKLFLEMEQQIKGFVTKRVEQRLRDYESGKDTKTDICITLYKANESMQMINDDCFTFLLAGSITTATTLTGATWFMLNNSAVYSKASEEVRKAFATDKDIDVNSSKNLRYLDAVIQETLRLFPAVPLGNSRVVPGGGVFTIDGHHVPAKTTVTVCPRACFISSHNWTRATEFVPERWLEEYKNEFPHDDPSSFKPFSYGPRDCIGRRAAESELRVTLAKLLWNFDLSLSAGMEDWPERCTPYIIWDRAPMSVHFERRTSDRAVSVSTSEDCKTLH